MDETQVQALLQQLQNNNAVQLKLIQYMEAEIDALNKRVAELESQLKNDSQDGKD